MGQKVNPISFRLGVRKHWQSSWFSSKEYGKLLKQDDDIRKTIKSGLPKATVGKIEIARDNKETVVNIYTSKPGIVIGRSGEGINRLKSKIQKRIKNSIELKIFEVSDPELNATLISETIALQIEKRVAYKRAMKQAISRAREKGVKGIKIKVSGRLGGAEIARSEMYSYGSLPLQTLKADIDFAKTQAITKYGVLGIKVWIFHGMRSLRKKLD